MSPSFSDITLLLVPQTLYSNITQAEHACSRKNNAKMKLISPS